MGRHARRLQRVRGVRKEQTTGAKDDEQTQKGVNIHEENFCQDEIDEFHEAKEKLLLEGNVSSSGDDGLSGDEEEVLGWSEEEEIKEDDKEEEDEEEFQVPLSLRQRFYTGSDEEDDITEQELKPEISDKAWGRKKKTFYAVEGEDELSGSEGSEMAAELEEEEAISLQQRMAAALKDSDFQAPSTTVIDDRELTEGVERKEERVVKDLSKLSREDKIEMLKKDSPELFDLLDDCDTHLSEIVHTLHPLVTVAKDTPTITDDGRTYLETKYHLNLLYCMNIMFYLHLKASGVPVHSHPVIQRIVEVKKLIGRLEPLDDELEGQIESLLDLLKDGRKTGKTSLDSVSSEEEEDREEKRLQTTESTLNDDENKKSKLKIQKESKNKPQPSQKRLKVDKNYSDGEEDPLKYYERISEQKRKRKQKLKRDKGQERGVAETEGSEVSGEEGEDGKRAVTYQISRNRGLIPQRKKELRNPRVKHRNKYRKALVKRKSQVRAVVMEMNRYSGETSGIRSNVSHSIKIK